MSNTEDKCFSSFNFPSSSNPSQTFLEYGSASLLNLDVDGIDLLTHSARGSPKGRFHLVAPQPSIPFLPPNECSCIPDVDERHEIDLRSKPRNPCGSSSDKCLEFTLASKHVDNLVNDYPEIIYGRSAELLHNEFVESGFDACSALSDNTEGKRCHNSSRCRLCNLTKPRNLYNYYTHSKDLDVKVLIQDINSGLADIPLALIGDLLNESYEQQICEHYNSRQGNTLACRSLAGHCSHTEASSLLCYPSGPNLEKLNTCVITNRDRENDGIEEVPRISELTVTSSQQFHLQGRVKQVECVLCTPEQIAIGVRSQYQCSFLNGVYNLDNTLIVKPTETIACSEQPMCVTVSPYIHGEAMVVMETGSVHLWSVNKGLTILRQPSGIPVGSNCWYQMVFAAHPRQVLLADSTGADLIDFRGGFTSQRALLSLPSSQVSNFERISAVQRHPRNTHHYLIATDQSLLVLDDRYVQHPVLKWRHHLQDPGQFLEIVSDSLPDCGDTVVVISGARHYDTHCYQYCSGHTDTRSSIPFTGESTILPPISTSLQWKVSSYDEWPLLISKDTPIPPEVTTQLSRPLIGIGAMTHSQMSGGGFTIFKMSAAGHLFHQRFAAFPVQERDSNMHASQQCDWQVIDKSASVRGDGKQVKLSAANERQCKEWVQELIEQKGKLKHTRYKNSDVVSVDKTKLFLKVTDVPAPHISCSLCSKTRRVFDTTEEQMEAESFCARCGLDVHFSVKMKELQRSKKVATQQSLDMERPCRPLCLVAEPENSRDPLSKCLLRNWMHDEITPLELHMPGSDTDANHKGVSVTSQPPLESEEPTAVHRARHKDLLPPSRPRSAPPVLSEETETVVVADQRSLSAQMAADQLSLTAHIALHSSSPKQGIPLQERVLRESHSVPGSPSRPRPVDSLSRSPAKKPRKSAAYTMGF